MHETEFDIHLAGLADVASRERRRLESKSTTMPLRSYFAIGSLALIALLFALDATLDKKSDPFGFDRAGYSAKDIR